MDKEPKECPKCSDGGTVFPTGLPEIMICAKCSTIYKSTEFGTLEEMTEFDLSLLEEKAQEILKKYQGLMNGELNVNLDVKDIGKVGEALGTLMASALAGFRNVMCEKNIIPHPALDNIVIQALIMQLSISVAQMVRQRTDPEDEFKKRVKILKGTFNFALKSFVERFVSGATILTMEVDDDSEGKDGDDQSGTG